MIRESLGVVVLMCTVLILAGSSALAQAAAVPARTIDMTVPMHDPNGKSLPDFESMAPAADDPNCAKCPPMTLGRVVAAALFQPEKDISAAEAWARGALAMRIRDDKAAVLTADEVSKIKTLVIRKYPSPLLVMQVYPLLDPADKPGAVKP